VPLLFIFILVTLLLVVFILFFSTDKVPDDAESLFFLDFLDLLPLEAAALFLLIPDLLFLD
jgi:hypothetical protein